MLLIKEKLKKAIKQTIAASLLLTLFFHLQIFTPIEKAQASEATENVLTIDLNEEDILNLDVTQENNQEEETNNQEERDSDQNQEVDSDEIPEKPMDIKERTFESLFLIDKQKKDLREAIKHFKEGTEGEYIEEKEDIIETKKEEVVAEERITANVYLNSILYISPSRWSVWINNNKITNETNSSDSEIFILNVAKEKVIILWKVSLSKWEIIVPDPDYLETVEINEYNEVENIFTLRPNQTYLPLEDKVIEGRVQTGETPQKESEE